MNTPISAAISDAFTYTFAVHDLGRIRWVFTQQPQNGVAAALNTLSHRRALADHRSREVTMPNNDTLYTLAWLDLAAGPLELDIPAMPERYYSFAFIDCFTNNFACLSSRTQGQKASRWWLAGPAWQGQVPEGRQLLRAPCNDVWMLVRTLIDGPEDAAIVHALQDQMRLEPAESNQAARPFESQPAEQSAAQYLEFVNEILGRNSIPQAEQAMVQSWYSLGIQPGIKNVWASLTPEVQQAWNDNFVELLKHLKSSRPGTGKIGAHWYAGLPQLGNFADDYTYRAYIALTGIGALEPVEAIYATCSSDSAGDKLNGQSSYVLTLPPGMPINAFWSLSMYQFEPDGRGFFVDNSLNRYTIGDRTPGLQYEADGSLQLKFQHNAPQNTANWLPCPTGRFSLAIRLYLPKPDLLEGRFVMPEVEKIQ